MSLPIAATGPLKVLMKPILTVFCWATAGAAATRQREDRAAGKQYAFHDVSTLRNEMTGGELSAPRPRRAI